VQDYSSKEMKEDIESSGTQNNSWIYCNTKSIYQIHSGWKFYIPVTPDLFNDTLKVIKPIFNKFNISYKYPINTKTLVKINLGSYGWSQIGKNIVFYMPQINTQLLAEISTLLLEKNRPYPKVHHAIELIKDIPIYYRHGNYHNFDKKDDRFNFDNHKIDKSIIMDLESILNIEKKTDKEIDSFLLNYPVFDIITQSGKGGVFKSIDFSQKKFTEVIVKIGYNVGGVRENGIDGKTLLLNERLFLEKLKRKSIKEFKTPDILDFKVNKNSSIVYKFIEGVSGVEKYIDNNLTPIEIRNCLRAIIELHYNGIIWGDAKIGNFIWDIDGSLNMIDFELSHDTGTDRLCELRTFNIIDISKKTSPEDNDIIDFLVSVLFEHSIDRQSEIYLEQFLKKDYSSEVKKACQKFLKETLQRIDEKRPTTMAIINTGLVLNPK